ncbi:MAG: hypothetical protein JWO38_8215 [Gemmataceae bacterium]|nr:hypothetical protein [Gemmataceae bacterium]
MHREATMFSFFGYNFCWPVRTPRVQVQSGRWQPRTRDGSEPDHVWTSSGWLTYPAERRKGVTTPAPV